MLSQFVLFRQLGPLVALYSATSATLSEFAASDVRAEVFIDSTLPVCPLSVVWARLSCANRTATNKKARWNNRFFFIRDLLWLKDFDVDVADRRVLEFELGAVYGAQILGVDAV